MYSYVCTVHTCALFFLLFLVTLTCMITVWKVNPESGTPGFESFIESAASDQPLDLHDPYLSLFPALLFLFWRVSLWNSLNQLWNKSSSHCRGTSCREICQCAFLLVLINVRLWTKVTYRKTILKASMDL